MPLSPRSLPRTLLCSALAAAALAALPAAASATPQTLTFTPEADTYVGADAPTATHGGSTAMWVDADPAKQSFVRFNLSGLAGHNVVGAKLRMTQTDSAGLGGRVWAMSSTTWPEALTWNTRPAIDGPLLASYGTVATGFSYSVELGAGAVHDGLVSYGMDSTSGDGSHWATRESTTPPELVVTYDDNPPAIIDGLSQIADASTGSSEPTYFSGNHRAVVTSGGRTLAVYGRHAVGVQLTWRDPAGSWHNTSTGTTNDGLVLSGTGTGDWTASIVAGRDANGAENAWVVWTGMNVGGLRPLAMRRITNLDSPDGPRIGPVVTIDSGTRGAYRGDIALEKGTDGRNRAVVLWSRRATDTTYELVTTWFSDLTSDTPQLTDRKVLETSGSSSHFGSLISTPTGTTVVARVGSGVLGNYTHSLSAPRTSWPAGAAGPGISSKSAPTGVGVANGEVLVAVERDATTHVSNVYRLTAKGTAVTSTVELSGREQPALAGDGTRAWLVAVRSSDRYLVSRAYSPTTGWTSSDRLEVGAEGGGSYAWPNTVRGVDGRLRFVFEGAGTTTNRSSVFAFQRQV